MEITKENIDEIIILKLRGNIISGVDANQIHQMVHEGLEADNRNFILDMSDVSIINSSGVGILIGALTAAKNQNGNVILAAVSQKVTHIFEMMHLDQVFGMYDTIEAARQSYL